MTQTNSPQDELHKFLTDPETMGRAAQRSMQRRKELIDRVNSPQEPHQYEDEDLRGALEVLALNDYHQATSISRDVDDVMQLITQKQLEARLEELEHLKKKFDRIDVEWYANERIDQLTTQKGK